MKAVSDEDLNLLACHTVLLCKQFGHFEGSWCYLQSHTVQEGMSGTICLLTQHVRNYRPTDTACQELYAYWHSMSGTICLLTQHVIPDDLNLQYNHCENFSCPTVFSGSYLLDVSESDAFALLCIKNCQVLVNQIYLLFRTHKIFVC
jgi:hypothetical protein